MTDENPMTDENKEKIKKSRNLTLIMAILVSITAAMRWLGLFGFDENSMGPMFSTILALVLFATAAYKHKSLSKL